MPYYNTKQPQQARLVVVNGKEADKAIFGLRGDFYCRLHLYADEHIVICKPRLDRIILGIFSKSLSIASLWIGGSLVLFGLHPFGSGNALWNAISAFMVSIAAMNLWLLAGPDDLDLDLRKRTYWYCRGLLYLAPKLMGTFNDILTVEVQRTHDPRHPRYLLMLVWNVPKRRATCLGQFQTLEQADTQRTRLVDALAL